MLITFHASEPVLAAPNRPPPENDGRGIHEFRRRLLVRRHDGFVVGSRLAEFLGSGNDDPLCGNDPQRDGCIEQQLSRVTPLHEDADIGRSIWRKLQAE